MKFENCPGKFGCAPQRARVRKLGRKTKDERTGPRPKYEETIQSVETRVVSFLTDLGTSFVGEMDPENLEVQKHIPTVLIVSHGATISCMERVLTN